MKDEYDQTKELLLHSSPTLAAHYDLDKIKEKEDTLRSTIEELTAQGASSKDTLLSYDEYLKLFSTIPDILSKTQDMAVMDALLRKFFSNFTITGTEDGFGRGSTVAYKLNEPWNGFVENNDFVLGAG